MDLTAARVPGGAPVSDVVLSLGPYRFGARFESSAAPRTCAAFRGLLPFTSQVIHVRWSGEAVWAPPRRFVDRRRARERHDLSTSWRSVVVSGRRERNGAAHRLRHFASKAGPLAGNHFLTITSGLEHLPEVGRLVLWQGAQSLRIDAA
jgi:hypothetical protein